MHFIGTNIGSTVNYAILLTTRYRKERAGGRAKVDAIETALARSFPAVVTSGQVASIVAR